MGQVIASGERERAGVDHGVLGQLKGRAGQGGRLAHGPAGRAVVRLLGGPLQVPDDQPRRTDRQQIANRLMPQRPVTFHGVTEGIQPRDHRYHRRERVSQLRIHQGMHGVERVAGNRSLDLLLRIAQNGERRDFRTRSRRGRQRDDRQPRGAQAGPFGMHAANARKIARRQVSSRFGAIHRAASTDGQHNVVPVGSQPRRQGVDARDGRVGRHLREQRHARQHLLHPRQARQPDQRAVGHQQGTATVLGGKPGELSDRPVAKRDRGREVEGPDAGFVFFSRGTHRIGFHWSKASAAAPTAPL